MNKNSYNKGKRRNKLQSFFLLVFISILAIIIPPVVAQVSNPTSIVQIQQNPKQLVDQAEELYQNQEFKEAVSFWKQAAQAFGNSGEKLNQAMALSNLSLTYQKLGQWEEAEQTIKQSLEIIENEPQEQQKAQVLAQTLDIQGGLQRQRGEAAQAIDTWQQAHQIYVQINEPFQAAQNKLNQSHAMQDFGLYPRACKTLLVSLGNPFGDLTCPPLEQQIPGQKTSEILTPQQLTTRIQEIPKTDLSLLTVKALRSLGDVLRVLGQQEQSQAILTNSLGLAEKLDSSENNAEISAIYLSLGNTVRNIQNTAVCNLDDVSISQSLTKETLGLPNEPDIPCTTIALAYYQQAENNSLTNTSKVKAQLNRLSLLIEIPELQSIEISNLWNNIQSELEELTNSRAEIYARVNLAQSLICLNTRLSNNNSKDKSEFSSPIVRQCKLSNSNNQIQGDQAPPIPSWSDIEQILTPALTTAENLENQQAEEYILGYLGGIAQQRGNYSEAKNLTQQALDLDPRNKWANISYRWYWQLGRLNQIQGQTQDAIKAYTSAYENLKSLRRDLVAINPDLRFNFRDSVEPVYRELVDLLLRGENPSPKNLTLARDVIEALQLAELDNFFQDPCVNVKPEAVDQIIENVAKPTAVIYGIILKDRLEMILKLPGKENLTSYSTKISQKDITENLNELIERVRDRTRYSYQVQEYSQKVYEWIISPVEAKLQENNIENLVFVLDGLLRNIPMAVLYDQNEQKYLIEKYPIALVPGLQLLSPKPFKDIEPSQLNVLTAGLSQERIFEEEQRQFQGLEYVQKELTKIQSEVPESYELLDQNFNNEKLQAQLATNKYNVAHFATHGEFDSDPNKTFIVLSDQLLKIKDLDNLLRVTKENQSIPIELLVLSACQTAIGDNRATLGLAGVAVRAGARSTMATLWSVGDESTAELMGEFYHQLINTEDINKAEALQKAQIKILHNQELDHEYWDHPYYWASFVLLGNWL
ncbi:MAG: CHAT domain-containing protein [Xenococcus sp. (in: cyanobacteria)]